MSLIEKYIYNKKLLFRIKQHFETYIKFQNLVYKWNKAINLTSYKKDDFLFHAIIEPLIIFNKINFPQNILDIGTGMGNPSISFAITFPEIDIYCTEINKKRLSFLNFVKTELNLKNLKIIENYSENFDIITARAFKSFEEFLIFIKKNKIKHKKILFYFKKFFPKNYKIIEKIEYSPPYKKEKYFQIIFEEIGIEMK